MKAIKQLSFLLCFLIFSVSLIAQDKHLNDTLSPAVLMADKTYAGMSISSVDPADLPVMASATGETEIVKYIQTLPGVATGSGGGSAYYVRGGNLGNNLQTLDGVPVYGASHLLGLSSSYPLEIISSADFQVGGFSSEEGNLSASHIKMTSRNGSYDKASSKAYASNFLLGAYATTPVIKDRLSLVASLRVSPVRFEYDALSGMVDDSFIFDLKKASVYDAYGKLSWRISDSKNLSWSVFNTFDGYRYDMKDGSEDSMSWSNLVTILRYRQSFGRRSTMETTAAYNHFSNSQGMFKQMGQVGNNLLLRSTLDEVSVHAMAVSKLHRIVSTQYGLKTRYAVFNPGSANIMESYGMFPKKSSTLKDNPCNSLMATLHGQVEIGKSEGSIIRLASRMNWQSSAGFAPEFSALGRAAITEWCGLEASFDHLVQYYHTLEGIPLGWSLDMMVPATGNIGPEKATQCSAGAYLKVGGHYLSVCAYDKNMSGLLWYADASKIFDMSLAGWKDGVEAGTGTSRGIEVKCQKDGKVLRYKLAYTLSKTDRTFKNLNEGLPMPAKFDRRHIFNADMSLLAWSTDRLSLALGGLFTYQSGHWETVTAGSWYDDNFVTGPVHIDFYTGLNNYQMPPYIRCDISADLKWSGKRHDQELSAGIYNVLNRHNPSWLSYNPDTRQWQQVSLLPVMPSFRYTIDF